MAMRLTGTAARNDAVLLSWQGRDRVTPSIPETYFQSGLKGDKDTYLMATNFCAFGWGTAGIYLRL